MEKEKTERAGIRVIFSVAFFIFSWYATKKEGYGMFRAEYCSPLGRLTLASDGKALWGLWIKGQKYFGASLSVADFPLKDCGVFQEAFLWLDAYFAGKRPGCAHLPLHLSGTAFQQAVWRILCEIPYGQTRTYGAIAKALVESSLYKRMSPQAVGAAIGRNPIGIVVPCHRVIGLGGNVTGYAAGVEKKLFLLRHEGVDCSSLFLPKRID